MDGTSGPDGTGAAYLALQPILPAPMQAGQFPLNVNGVGILLRRSGTGEVVVDTLLNFDPDSSALHAAIRVGMLRRSEEFLARLVLLDDTLVLFSGTKLIFLQQGPPGTNGLDSIGVSYEGPGRDIARLRIDPLSPILRFGDSLQLNVTAWDSSGHDVPSFFVSWNVSDTAVARVNALGLLRAPSLRSGITITALAPNGANTTTEASFVPAPVGVRLVGSDTVVAPVGTAVPFAVRVVAADSLGVPGVPVRFSALTAGGAVTDTVLSTDSTGFAATQVVVGDTLRDYGYDAQAEGLAPGHLTVDAIAGPPAAIKIAGGNSQSGPVAAELAQPLVVTVHDVHGNPVAGQRVNFVVTSGSGSVWAGSNNTNDSGIAMERWTLGTSTAVLQQLEARAVDNTTGAPLLFAHFTATALPGPADSLELVAGDGQAGVVGAALADSLAVRVRDRYGNPVPGAVVQWAAEQGSVTAGSAASDAQGLSRATWVLGQAPGAQRATATVGSLSPAHFGATAAAGAPAAMAAQAGTGQTGVVGSALAESLAVRLTDAFGNPVGGASVTWTTGNGGTITSSGPSGADGVARAVWRLGTVAGTQTAQAAVGGLAVSFSASAEAGPAAQVTVSGSPTTLDALGSQLTLGAAVHDAFGNVISNPTIAWSSSDTTVAVVDATGCVTARHDGTARITATVAGSVAGSADVTVRQAVASVSVTPEQTTLSAVGAWVQLELTALDPNGNPVSQPEVTWESSNTQVATVSAGGLVTAVGSGQVTITATVSGAVVQPVTLSVAVSVVPTVAAVEVAPATGTLTALGRTLALQGTAVDAQGNPLAGVSLSWHSSNEAVATVSGAGVVTAVGNGSATIEASVGGFTGSAQITVAQAPAAVAVSPATVTLSALGATGALSATVTDANGHPMSAPATWTSSNSGVAGVDGSGLVTAVANGTATITATSGGVSGTAAVTVAQVVATVQVSPATVSLTSAGQQATLTAVARDARDNVVPGAVMGWNSGNPAVATVDGSGAVTAVANGTATITASSGGRSGTATVSVTLPAPPPQVGSVEVTPGSATLTALGATVQLTATVLATDQSVMSGAAVTWSSGNSGIASVDDAGRVTAVANGTVTITATSGGVPGTATVTVAQVPATVVVDPATVSLSALGATAQLGAVVKDANGHVVGGAAVSWSSSNDAVATVSGAGLATAVANGTATVTASSGSVSGTAGVTVAQVVATVQVSPATVSLSALGATAQLGAVVKDANGHPIAGAAVAWSSSDEAVATVSGGLVTAVANGTASITASYEGIAGSAAVTVEQVPAAVVVSPNTLSLTAVGEAAPLSAVVKDANGHVIDGAAVIWSSSDEAVATVSGGLVTAVANGTATITASSGGKSGSATVTVSIAAAPIAVVIQVGRGDTKTIQIGSLGNTPVAILTTGSFDAANVDPTSVLFQGVAPLDNYSLTDVDGDGDLDLQLHFETDALQLTAGLATVTLTGHTRDGAAILGQETVTVIAKGPSYPAPHK